MSEKESDDDLNTNSSEENVTKDINDVLERHSKQGQTSQLKQVNEENHEVKDVS